jgi:two-component system sensor histidine kinase KdpD
MADRDYSRPDPEALLRLAEREQPGRGKLKIFFGMAAGVGKTFAMLTEAARLREDGADVVIGYLESHRREDTDALAAGIEAVPRMRLEYRGKILEEMDLDGVIARRPKLALVDELAHTNAPGARNRKRYQDVLELLDHGIDVYSTVNVQHVESYADTVEEISGITVSERLPDSVFDLADQVVLIDLSPEELLKRLSEGKVYLGDRAQAALESFFKKSTLTALREMSLRHTALLVTHQLASYGQAHEPHALISAGERLLVAVSPSPNSAHLIRWTRQRAFNLKAEWTALYVETGAALADEAREGLRRNMNLARQLGGTMVTIPADDVALALIRFARQNAITEIVVGKSGLARRAPFLRRRTVTERIMKMSGDIDVDVVQEKGATLRSPRFRLSTYLRPERASLAKMAIVLAGVTGLSVLAEPLIGYRSISAIYLMAVIALSLLASRTAVLVGAALSALLWDYFFLPPRFTFVIRQLEDVLMFFLYFITAAALAFFMSRLRANQTMLAVRARRMSLLLDFSQALSQQHTLDEIVRSGLEHVSRYLEAQVLILLRDGSGGLERTARSITDIAVDQRELGAAQWCFDSRTPCGRYTDTLHMAQFHYVPLVTPDAVVGVIGIALPEGKSWLPDHEDSFQMLGRSLAVSIERELLAEENRRNLMAKESERLGRVLLNTVSHELRTPLTTIKGSITALMDPETGADVETRRLLLAETLMATDRLNTIVENLLSMSRLESGTIRLKRSPTDIFDLLSVVGDALRRQSKDHPLSVRVDEDIPPIPLDFTLMVQALSNILLNAARHTPPGTPITLSAESTNEGISITVADEGPGVPVDELPRLFERFFRGRRAATGGVGLGLSICKGIVEAHGGRIAAYINRAGGLSVSIVMPGGGSAEPGSGAPVAAEAPGP